MNALAQIIELADRAGEDELRSALISDLASVRFPEFVRYSWPELHEDKEEPFRWAWYIDCVGEHLEAAFAEEIIWLLINIVPGFAKSLICSVMFPAWAWLHKPWWRFLCSGTNDDLTLRDARRHKQLVNSNWYQRTFLPDWLLDRAIAADTNFANTRGGSRLSKTVKSSVTGQRPHCRVVDDPNDPEKITTEEFGRVAHWIDHTLLKRRAKLTSPLISIQARVGEGDFTGHLMNRARKPHTIHLVLPNRYVPKRAFASWVLNRRTHLPWLDQRTEEDELLNPSLMDQDTTEQEIEADEAADAAQNQQDPTPEGGIIYRKEMFQRWSIAPDDTPTENWEEEPYTYPTFPLPDPMDFVFLTCDPNNLKADKATKRTDFAVVDVWGAKTPAGLVLPNLYLIEELRGKYNVSQTIQIIVELMRKYAATISRVLIESKANGPSVIAGVRAVAGYAHEASLPRQHQHIRDWNVQGETKPQRARGCVHVAQARRVFIQCPYENPELLPWLAEVCGFPNRTRDDRADTLSMALAYADRHPDGR